MKNKIIISILTIIVIIISAFLGWYFAQKPQEDKEKIDGIVVNVQNNIDYSSKMITSYEEYQELLNTHKVNVTKDKLLTKKDFNKSDYIIDYIPYDKDLKITKSIDVQVLEGGVEITYYLNHEVKTEDQLLLYLIPIPKDSIKDYNLANRIFKYDE